MSADTLESIYEPYKTAGLAVTRPDGTGLGLPIAYQLVKRMSGRLCVGSREGVGTQVILTLPLERLAVEGDTMFLIGEGPGKMPAPVSVNHSSDSAPSLRYEQKADSPRVGVATVHLDTQVGTVTSVLAEHTAIPPALIVASSSAPATAIAWSDGSAPTLSVPALGFQDGTAVTALHTSSMATIPAALTITTGTQVAPLLVTAPPVANTSRMKLTLERPTTPAHDVIVLPPSSADSPGEAAPSALLESAGPSNATQSGAGANTDLYVEAKKAGLRVLVVEDSLVNQKLLVRVLASLGVDADVCNNGKHSV